MIRHAWVRRLHRWLSMAFTLAAAVVTGVVLAQEDPAAWVYLSPLPPLGALLVTGLYLFALPNAVRLGGPERAARRG